MGTLTLISIGMSSANVNLTSLGADVWGTFDGNTTILDFKSGNSGTEIAPATFGTGAGFFSFASGGRTVNWTDGTNVGTSSNANVAFESSSNGPAVGVDIPMLANTTLRRYWVYCSVFNGNTNVTISLSDASATALTDTTTITIGGGLVGDAVIVFDAAAGSAAQTVNVRLENPANGPLQAIQAAAYKVSAGAGNSIAVPAGSLALTGLVPTVVATANQSIAVPAGSLILSGKVPTVTVSNNQSIAAPAGSLSLSAQVPTVVATANQVISVPAGSLTMAALVPAVTATANQTIAVPLATLTLTANAPTVANGVSIAVPAGSLTLAGFAPTVTATANNNIDVPLAQMTLSAFAPQVMGDPGAIGGSNLGGGGGAGKHHDGWSGKFEFKKTPLKVLQLPRKIAEDESTIVEVTGTIAATQDSIAVHELDDDEEAILLLLH